MGSDVNWIMTPKAGLGALKLGMTPEQVAAAAGAYGGVALTRDGGVTTNDLDETLKLFGEFFSDEDAAAVRGAIEGQQSGPKSRTDVLQAGGVTLDYLDGRLAAIQTSAAAQEASIDGRHVFELEAVEALRLIERLNGAPGRYRSTQAAFEALAVSLDGFTIVDDGAPVRPLGRSDERFRERTIELRSQPAIAEGEAHQFVSASFL